MLFDCSYTTCLDRKSPDSCSAHQTQDEASEIEKTNLELPCLLSYSYSLPLMVAKVKHQREGMTQG